MIQNAGDQTGNAAEYE